MANLTIKQGLNANAIRSIPKQWDAEWFRRFIVNHLQNADARNQTAGPGIAISGTEVFPGTIKTAGIPLSSLAAIAAFTTVGNPTGSSASPIAMTPAQLTALVQQFTTSVSGAVPSGPGNPQYVLCSDGVWRLGAQVVGGAIPMPEDGIPGEDGNPIPGPQGPAGGAGATGPPGSAIVGDDGTPGEDAWTIPGPQGPSGNPGGTGATGPVGPIGLAVDDSGIPGEDGSPIPGPQGPQGSTGAVGPIGPIGLATDDGPMGEDGYPLPGPQGPMGPAGATAAYTPEITWGQALIDLGPLRRAGSFYIELPYNNFFAATQVGYPAFVWADQGSTEDQCTQAHCTARVVSRTKIRVYFMSLNNYLIGGARLFNFMVPSVSQYFAPYVPKPGDGPYLARDYV